MSSGKTRITISSSPSHNVCSRRIYTYFIYMYSEATHCGLVSGPIASSKQKEKKLAAERREGYIATDKMTKADLCLLLILAPKRKKERKNSRRFPTRDKNPHSQRSSLHPSSSAHRIIRRRKKTTRKFNSKSTRCAGRSVGRHKLLCRFIFKNKKSNFNKFKIQEARGRNRCATLLISFFPLFRVRSRKGGGKGRHFS